jgi:hypothetical protein
MRTPLGCTAIRCSVAGAPPPIRTRANASQIPIDRAVARHWVTGGTGGNLAWLGTVLARAGCLAAAVNHPGNNAIDG